MLGMRSLAVGAVISLLIGAGLLSGFATSTASSATASPRCHSRVSAGVLPPWGRGGFSDPRPRMPYELAVDGRIAALVFGYPLLSPPAENRADKILWVAPEKRSRGHARTSPSCCT